MPHSYFKLRCWTAPCASATTRRSTPPIIWTTSNFILSPQGARDAIQGRVAGMGHDDVGASHAYVEQDQPQRLGCAGSHLHPLRVSRAVVEVGHSAPQFPRAGGVHVVERHPGQFDPTRFGVPF